MSQKIQNEWQVGGEIVQTMFKGLFCEWSFVKRVLKQELVEMILFIYFVCFDKK